MTDLLTSPATIALVVGEVLFWVFIVAGLATRYLLRAPRLGAVLLAGTVLVDIGILVVAVVDVRTGGTATVMHGIAALYVGFSVAFGRSMIAWADGHAAHRWGDGPRPRRVPRRGPERAAHEWLQFRRWLLAGGIAAGALTLVIALAGPGAEVDELYSWYARLLLVTVAWFASGPAWHLTGRDGDHDDHDTRSTTTTGA